MTEASALHRSPAVATIAAKLVIESSVDRERLANVASLLDDPTLQLRERDMPIGVTAFSPVATDVGRGGALAHSVGPFTGSDGHPVWFDFIRRARLVPVYVAGEARPAVLFSIRELPLHIGDLIRPVEVMRLLQRRYALGPGSVWIRSDLIAGGAPPDTYVGLLITEGHVTFSPPPIDAGGRLTMPPGARCTLELTFPPQTSTAADSTAGRDAAESVLQVPSTATFVLGGHHLDETAVGDGHAEVFGQSIDFHWEGTSAGYESDLHSILVPMTPSVEVVAPSVVRSPLAGVSGTATISRGGWLLPVATIDVDAPPVASGATGLALLADTGLLLTWTGLQDGPVRLRRPWVALLPGVVGVVEAAAVSVGGHQRFELWADTRARFRSDIALRYPDSFPAAFVSTAGDSDVVVTAGAVDARLDRPVDVRGMPLSLHTLRSQVVLTTTDTVGTVRIRDLDVLDEAIELAATRPVDVGGSISLALRNALFTTTPVATLTVLARLDGPEIATEGTVSSASGSTASCRPCPIRMPPTSAGCSPAPTHTTTSPPSPNY